MGTFIRRFFAAGGTRFKIALAVVLALALALSLSFCSRPAYAGTLGTGTVVNCSYSVNVRSGPSSSYSIVGKAPKGAVYEVTGQSGSWFSITFGGRTAYIFYDYLAVVYSPALSFKGKVVNCTYDVNVRSGPGGSYSKLGTAPKDAVYAVAGQTGDWYRIIYNGLTAYIYSGYLSVYQYQETAVKPIIEAYYGSWAAYDGYTPASIPADKVNVVAYAFARLDSSLNVQMGDTNIDPKNFAALKDLKTKYPNLITTISIGGWSGSGRFSDAALTDSSRSAFAASAIKFMKLYGFDGIDIDWEYPVSGGLDTNTTRPEDKTNFTLMMAQLRRALDDQGSKDGRRYILTFAGAADKSYSDNVELSKLAQYVDFALLMTYDIHGPWSRYTDFNSPLYTPSGTSPQSKWSCDDAVKLWVSKGFPANKIVMGIPFYGYRYTGVGSTNNGLYQKYSSALEITYDRIVSLYMPSYKRYWQQEACVPWLYGDSAFISYDDGQSAGLKAGYIKQNGLAGAGIWELSQNKDGTLLGVIYDKLK